MGWLNMVLRAGVLSLHGVVSWGAQCREVSWDAQFPSYYGSQPGEGGGEHIKDLYDGY